MIAASQRDERGPFNCLGSSLTMCQLLSRLLVNSSSNCYLINSLMLPGTQS